jgi:O-antigen/teichoic acid export membrane protein
MSFTSDSIPDSRRPAAQRAAGWAALDQCFFGTSNVALNLVLARWLPPEAYGAFTLGQVGLVFAGVVHAALLVEPMLVLAARERAGFRGYLQLLLIGHLGFCALAAALLLAIGALVAPAVAAALHAAAVAAPCVLALWLLRRACYAAATPRTAAVASAVHLAGSLGVIAALHGLDRLGPVSALHGVAAVSAAVAAVMLRLLRAPILRAPDRALLARLLPEHARLARRLVVIVPFEWLPANFPYLVLPTLGGVGSAALLRAAMNLVQPLMQIHSALRMLLVPAFVRAQDGDMRAAHGFERVAAVIVGGALLWWGLLAAHGAPLAEWLYGGRYPEAGALLGLLGAIPVFTAVCAIARSRLRARLALGDELRAHAAASAVAVALGLPAMSLYGVMGAAAAGVSAYAVLTGWQIAALRRRGPAAEPGAAAPPLRRAV